jgi:hypothetical protein
MPRTDPQPRSGDRSVILPDPTKLTLRETLVQAGDRLPISSSGTCFTPVEPPGIPAGLRRQVGTAAMPWRPFRRQHCGEVPDAAAGVTAGCQGAGGRRGCLPTLPGAWAQAGARSDAAWGLRPFMQTDSRASRWPAQMTTGRLRQRAPPRTSRATRSPLPPRPRSPSCAAGSHTIAGPARRSRAHAIP